MPLLLGAIADDHTGASDLAAMLTEQGVATVLVFGSDIGNHAEGAQAVVAALKSRSTPPAKARARSLAAFEGLRRAGARQIYFKYCSTFDSTSEGNIGPVTEALLDALDAPFTVAVPALPVNGRTQYAGHLFVHGTLLSETHMREHPVTPMTDSNLVRHLQHQMQGKVGLISFDVVRRGAEAVREDMERLQHEGVRVALVDILNEDDLAAVAAACVDLPLITGGSGLAMALPAEWRRRGLLPADPPAIRRAEQGGPTLILAGSCSAVTLEQLAALDESTRRNRHPYAIQQIDGLALLADAEREINRLLTGARDALSDHGWALIRSSADAAERNELERRARAEGMDPGSVGRLIESTFGRLASVTTDSGEVASLVVAGGETSGAVASALDLRAMDVEGVLDPGVPVLRSRENPERRVVFKSGNFGSQTFFSKALSWFGVDVGNPSNASV